MKSDYKVAAIMPVYNAEDYLETAVGSLVNQTIGFSNIEVILIDDASDDGSRDIMEEYSLRYGNVKCFYMGENSGSPAAPRNVGMEHVTAPYMIFLDVDDLLLDDCLEVLHDIAQKENADFIQCNHLRKIDGKYYVHESVCEKNDDFIEVSDILQLRGTTWGNLFRTSLVGEDRFCKDVFFEDRIFVLETSIKACKILYLPNFYGFVYNLDNADSLTHNISFDSLERAVNGFCVERDIFIENGLDCDIFNLNFHLLYFMFFKFHGSGREKIIFLAKLRDLEISLDYPVKLNSEIIDVINRAVLNERYALAIILSRLFGLVYENDMIRNYVFKKYSGVKQIDIGQNSSQNLKNGTKTFQ